MENTLKSGTWDRLTTLVCTKHSMKLGARDHRSTMPCNQSAACSCLGHVIVNVLGASINPVSIRTHKPYGVYVILVWLIRIHTDTSIC